MWERYGYPRKKHLKTSVEQIPGAPELKQAEETAEPIGAAIRKAPWRYILAFVCGAVLAVCVTFYNFNGEYHKTRASWAVRLAGAVVNRTWILSNWLEESRYDSQVLASFEPIRELLWRPSETRGLPRSLLFRLAVALLSEYKTVYGYSGVYLVDLGGHVVAQATYSPVFDSQVEEKCRAAARDGSFRTELLGESPDSTTIVFIMPVFWGPGAKAAGFRQRGPIGVVALVDPLAREIFPMLTTESYPTRTGETLLLGFRRSEGVYLSPRRHSLIVPDSSADSRDTLVSAVRSTIGGPPTFREYTDYRGMPVLASIQKIPSVAGVVVCKVDRQEALEEFHHTARLEALVAGIAVLLYGGVLVGYRRSLLTREMKLRLAQQQAILKLKEYAQEIVDAVPSGLLLLSPEHRILSASQSFLKGFHLSTEDVVGRELREVMEADSLPVWNRDGLASEVHPRIVQIRMKSGDNIRKPCRIAIKSLAQSEKDVRLLMVIEDLSESERLRVAEEVLARRLSELVQSLEAIVWEGDAATLHFTFVSHKVKEILGYSSEQWLTDLSLWHEHIHPDDRCATMQEYRAAAAKGSNKVLEYRFLTADGRVVWLRDSISPIRDDEGPVRHLRGVMVDVTERKNADDAISRLNQDLAYRAAELEATNKELESFTHSVSHDLQAPLRQIEGFSKILLRELGSKLDSVARRNLDRILEGSQYMRRMVDDLLNLARAARSELALQLTGLNSLVEDVLRDLRPEMEGRQIEWQIGRLPFVDCDPGLMKQVFANLLSNAIKYTRPRERAVIQVGVTVMDGESVLFVRDNGVGFNLKYADKLFGVFQRLHRSEDFEGTGVGLATVQRVVRKHGGRIWAEAEIEKGATFYFTLAASEDRASAKKSTLPAGRVQ